MKRREFVAGLGGAAAWPLVVQAQQSAMPVIGFLSGATLESMREDVGFFHQGLAETGYIGNRNVMIEYRWAEGDNNRLPVLAANLVRRRVDIIVAFESTPAALAAKAATQTIPVVFQVGPDPVQSGLVASLARPGGNLTGNVSINVELIAKTISLVHELVPTSSTVAVLVNPANAVQTEIETREVQVAARLLGLRLVMLRASGPGDIEPAFVTLVAERAAGLVVSGENLFRTQRDQLVALAARYAVPTLSQFLEFARRGGLMSYGISAPELLRGVGVYAGRILKGEKPADLPVQQATTIKLIINLKTAKALGIDVPTGILARADEVIE